MKPSNEDSKPLRKRKRPWFTTVVLAATGICGLVIINYTGGLHRSPPWNGSSFWQWIVSPHLGWMVAGLLASRSVRASVALALGTSVSTFGGLYLVFSELQSPEGWLSSASAKEAGETAEAVAMVQWSMVLTFALIAAASFLRERSDRSKEAKPGR